MRSGGIFQSLRAFRRAEPMGRSLGGVGGTLGVPGHYWGGPRETRASSERAWEAPKTQKVFLGCLGGGQGLPWCDFERQGWAWGSTCEVDMLIFQRGQRCFCEVCVCMCVCVCVSFLFVVFLYVLHAICFLMIVTKILIVWL